MVTPKQSQLEDLNGDITGNGSTTSAISLTGSSGVVNCNSTRLDNLIGLTTEESATVPGGVPGASNGIFWVRDDAITVPMFTDSSGTDIVLSDGTASSQTLAQTLNLGSSTDGYNIELSDGDDLVLIGDTGGTKTIGYVLPAVSGAGESLTIIGQTAVLNGIGGPISLTSGNGQGSGSGGSITLTSGDGGASGNGGNVTFSVGSGLVDGIINIAGSGSSIAIIERAAVSSNTLVGDGSHGTIWVRDTDDLMFTDQSGTDIVITSNSIEFDFKLTGVFSGAGVPGTFEPQRPSKISGVIESVTLLRRTAGASGTTRVDVLLNGVSIFGSDPLKPQVLFSAGDNVIDTRTVFSTSAVVINDFFDVVLETVETGAAEDLIVIVRIS